MFEIKPEPRMDTSEKILYMILVELKNMAETLSKQESLHFKLIESLQKSENKTSNTCIPNNKSNTKKG